MNEETDNTTKQHNDWFAKRMSESYWGISSTASRLPRAAVSEEEREQRFSVLSPKIQLLFQHDATTRNLVEYYLQDDLTYTKVLEELVVALVEQRNTCLEDLQAAHMRRPFAITVSPDSYETLKWRCRFISIWKGFRESLACVRLRRKS